MFNQMRKEELMAIIHCNIFSNFIPDWNLMRFRSGSRDNIFNNYMKVSRIYTKIKHKGKIKENNKSKSILRFNSKFRLHQCTQILDLSNRNALRNFDSSRMQTKMRNTRQTVRL